MKRKSHSHWIALSDIATALMLIFLLLFALYLVKANNQEKQSKNATKIYQEFNLNLGRLLQDEFGSDLERLNAIITDDLAIRFIKPQLLFETGKADLSQEFKSVLDEFFPRYLKIITNEKIAPFLDEIRIEGHTSPFWGDEDQDSAYLKNMTLSSQRAEAVLFYIFKNSSQKELLKRHFRAIGFSSSKLVQSQNLKDSQRVEFRIFTNIERDLK